MNVSGKINVFVEKVETTADGQKKTITKLSTSIESPKVEGEKRDRVYCDVMFTKKAESEWPEARIDKLKDDVCYTLDLVDAFLSVRGWDSNGTRNKRIVIYVNAATPVSAKQFEKKAPLTKKESDELPF